MKRGSVVNVVLPGAFGKPRPGVVIQSDLFANHTSVTVLPVTSTVTGATPLFRLRIAPTSHNGLHAPSEVMVDRAMTVRPDKIRGTIGEVNETDTLRINRALALFLGIAG